MNQYRDWQFGTRQISQQIKGIEGTISVKGQPMLLASAVRGGIQSDVTFQFRMQQLVVSDVVLCAATTTLCKDSAVLTFPDN